MPPSDIEHKSGEAVEGCASGAVNIASISPDDNATGDDKKSSNEFHTDETSVDALSNDHIMPQEFTFFKKETGRSCFNPFRVCQHRADNSFRRNLIVLVQQIQTSATLPN